MAVHYKKQLLFLFAFAFVAVVRLPLSAAGNETFRFERIGIEAGLSNSEVTSIVQDSTGFLWIATKNGLNRFDGYQFKNFFNQHGQNNTIPANEIYHLLPGNGNDLWLATKRGIAYYSHKKEKFHHIPFKDNDEVHYDYYVNFLHKDYLGRILAATSNGIYKYNPQEDRFEKFFIQMPGYAYLNTAGFYALCTDRRNRLWLGTLDVGVFVYDPQNGHVFEIAHWEDKTNTLLDNKVFSFFSDSRSNIWIGTENGLYLHCSQHDTLQRFLPGDQNSPIPHRSVNNIHEDSQGRIWILTNGGLSIYDHATGHFARFSEDFTDPYSLSSNAVGAFLEDSYGNFWLGTLEDGLNVVKTHAIQFDNFIRMPNNPLSLNYPMVLSVAEDPDGNLWIGTNGGGINQVDRHRRSISYILPDPETPAGIQADAIMALRMDLQGNMWIGTYQGGVTLYNFQQNTFKTYRHNPEDATSISSDIVNDILPVSGQHLLLATNRGVNQYVAGDGSFRIWASESGDPLYRISSDFITQIIVDHKGDVWVATHHGLNRVSETQNKVESYFFTRQPGSLSGNSVYALLEDSSLRLWVGTDNGLNLYDSENNTFRVFTSLDGLPNSSINGLLEDENGFIWISTNNGLTRLDTQSFSFSSFDQNDGLSTVDFSRGAAFKGAGGRLYFGGRKGLVGFDPLIETRARPSSPVVFTRFFVNNKQVKPMDNVIGISGGVNYLDKIRLAHDQSFVTFEFTSINFLNPGKDRFYFLLEGYDHDWNYAGGVRSVSYNRLPPGQYTLRVRAVKDYDEVVYSRPLQVVIRPPFWYSTWAYLFYVVLATAMMGAAIRYSHNRAALKRMRFVEKMESEKIIELNQAKIRFFTNVSHEFKTPLTLIISPLEVLLKNGVKSQPVNAVTRTLETAYSNALRLSRLINQIMDLRRIDTGNMNLRAAKTDAIQLLKDISQNFRDYADNHGVDFEFIHLHSCVEVWLDKDKIEKVVFNLLSNAFRFTPSGGQIMLTAGMKGSEEAVCQTAYKSPEGFFCIEVTDTGQGIEPRKQQKIFQRFYQSDNDELANPASTGIGLSIVKEFVQLHKGCVKLKSEPGKGSTFTVLLPLGNSHLSKEEMGIRGENEQPLEQPAALLPQGERKTGVKPFFHDTARGYPHKILVVEDNLDLRNFILDNLEDKYEVHEADNGREGLRLAQTVHPDLIISDIMMPGISGIELVKTLKADIKTSHIPVILMTVLSELDQQLEGIGSGADAYITKPFHFSLLEANIVTLIENRRNIINKFHADTRPKASELPINKLDQAMLDKAMEVVERNMDNEEFTAEDFSREMCMSRTNLHVKLKALTNLSATEFIRTIRLKKAVELLSEQQYSISQVASMVGFKSISYFNRCFKNTYGESPSNYI